MTVPALKATEPSAPSMSWSSVQANLVPGGLADETGSVVRTRSAVPAGSTTAVRGAATAPETCGAIVVGAVAGVGATVVGAGGTLVAGACAPAGAGVITGLAPGGAGGAEGVVVCPCAVENAATIAVAPRMYKRFFILDGILPTVTVLWRTLSVNRTSC